MSEKVQTILQKVTAFTQSRYMQILMNGFIGVSALTICGSLFTLVKSIPITPWLNFLTASGLGDLLSIPVSITTDAIALYIALSMGYETAKSYEQDGLPVALVSLGSFLLVTPFGDSGVPLSAIGTQGMFLAIIVGIGAARLYIFLIQKGIRIKLPDSVPANVGGMFESLLPGGLTFVVFLAVRYGMSLTAYGSAQNLVYALLQAPLTNVGGGMGGLIVYTLASNLLWWFGIHGSMAAYVAMAPIVTTMSTENLAAFAAGEACPHPEWALMAFILIGGSGATLALNLLMVSPLCKSEQYRTLGKLALPTSLFNINEPLVFGTPIMLNPFLALPWLFCPIINLLISMFAYNIGFFVPTGASINNFLPVGIYGGMITASLSGVVMSVILLAVDLVVWLPFFKASDANLVKQEAARAAENAKA